MSLNVTRFIPHALAAGFARCLRMIDALGQAGRERMAALKAGAGADVVRQATAFGRLVRAMSLIMMLETRLKALVEAAAGGRLPRLAVSAPADASVASQAGGPAEDRETDTPALETDRAERPERPERLEERERFGFERGMTASAADDRPLSALAAEICRNLGFDAEATRRALAPFLELEALLAGEPAPELARAPSMDRARPRAPFPLAGPRASRPQEARVDARGPKKPP